MSSQSIEQRCPACGSKNIKAGRLGVHKHTFTPEGRLMWMGYKSSAFVCLDCAVLTSYLHERDLEDIRKLT
jgi:hypothetical protein